MPSRILAHLTGSAVAGKHMQSGLFPPCGARRRKAIGQSVLHRMSPTGAGQHDTVLRLGMERFSTAWWASG